MTSSGNNTLTIESKVGGGQNHSPWALETSFQDSSPRAMVNNTHSLQTSREEDVKAACSLACSSLHERPLG